MEQRIDVLDDTHYLLSKYINGVDFDSIRQYTKVNGVYKSALLYDRIIDYINSQDVDLVSKDEVNPICRQMGMPLLFSSTSELNITPNVQGIELISICSRVKFYFVISQFILFMEMILYIISEIFNSPRVFNLFSPLPILIVMGVLLNKEISGGDFNGTQFIKSIKRFFSRRSSRRS